MADCAKRHAGTVNTAFTLKNASIVTWRISCAGCSTGNRKKPPLFCGHILHRGVIEISESKDSSPAPVAARSKAWVYGRSLAGIVGSRPTGVMDVCCECCVLPGRGLCDELITRPEESYRLWSVVVCDLETSWMRRPWPAMGHSANNKQQTYIA